MSLVMSDGWRVGETAAMCSHPCHEWRWWWWWSDLMPTRSLAGSQDVIGMCVPAEAHFYDALKMHIWLYIWTLTAVCVVELCD